MPQLDQFTYFSQFFWLCLLFFTFYVLICNDGDGVLGISRILKLRNQLLSHRGKNIRSKDHNRFEDILRKGFSTGLDYMYSTLFEVDKWCKAGDLLGKRSLRTPAHRWFHAAVNLCEKHITRKNIFACLFYLIFFILTAQVDGGIAHAMEQSGSGSSPLPSIELQDDRWIESFFDQNDDQEASSFSPGPAADEGSSSSERVYRPTINRENFSKLDDFLENMETKAKFTSFQQEEYDRYMCVNQPRAGRIPFPSFSNYLSFCLKEKIEGFYVGRMPTDPKTYRWDIVLNKVIPPGSQPTDYLNLMFNLDSSDQKFKDSFLERIKSLLPKRR